MRKNERTLQMIKNYVSLYNSGMTPVEIAKKYNLSNRTVYDHLQMIADAAGVTRESLLERPHSEHMPCERITEPVKHINTEVLQTRLQDALSYMSEFKELVDIAIEDSEVYEDQMGRIEYGTWDNEGENSCGWNQEWHDARGLLQ